MRREDEADEFTHAKYFRRYAVSDVATVGDFVDSYCKPSILQSRSDMRAIFVEVGEIELERYGYTYLLPVQSVTGQTVAFFGSDEP